MDPINPIAVNPEALNQTPPLPPRSDKTIMLGLSILLLLMAGAIAYLSRQYVALQQKIVQAHTTPSPIPSPTPTPTPKITITINQKTGNNVYTNATDGYNIEFPKDWQVNQYGAITKDFSPEVKPSIQCGKMGIAQLSLITSSQQFRNEAPWGDLFTAENFYNLDNPSWNGFFKSGGGGINHDTLTLGTVGSQKAVKFVRVWTDVMECFPKTEYHYFIISPLSNNENLLVTQISYEINTGDDKTDQMMNEINQILSTFKFTNQMSNNTSSAAS